jgi:hypothetical protein
MNKPQVLRMFAVVILGGHQLLRKKRNATGANTGFVLQPSRSGFARRNLPQDGSGHSTLGSRHRARTFNAATNQGPNPAHRTQQTSSVDENRCKKSSRPFRRHLRSG